jgi:lauroyl/myristoyl acyltransferase
VSLAGWLALGGMRLGAALVPRLPFSLVRAAADVAGLASYGLSTRPRRALASNLSSVLDPGDPDLIALRLREAFRTQTHNYVDLFRLPSLTLGRIERMIDLDGWGQVDEVLAAGRGGVLAAAHLGNIDLVAQVACAHGTPVTIPVEPLAPRALLEYVTALRAAHGLRLVPVDEDALGAVSAGLKRGELVGFAVDRDVQGSGRATSFLGRHARVSHAPALIARRHRTAILPASVRRLPGGRFHATIHPPVWPRPGASTASLMSEVLAPIEAAIRDTPGQWVMFQPLFDGAEAR